MFICVTIKLNIMNLVFIYINEGGKTMNKIEEIKARLDNTMKGPWKSTKGVYGSTEIFAANGEPVYFIDSAGDVEMFPSEVEFISNAPSDVAFLLETIEKMKTALQFYSNEANYSSEEGVSVSVIDEDYGQVADDALKELGQ